MPEITPSMERRYVISSALAVLGFVVAVTAVILFGSYWGLMIGGVIIMIGWRVNPEGLSNEMMRKLRAAKG